MNDGKPLEPGEILYRKNLGTTLRKIAAEGRGTFYKGEITIIPVQRLSDTPPDIFRWFCG